MIQKNAYPTRPVMTLSETARMLGISYPTAHQWAQKGHLPTVKIGPKTFVLRDALEKMLKGHHKGCAA